MGFAVAASLLIVTLSLAVAGGHAVVTTYDTWQDVQASETSALDRLNRAYETVLTITEVKVKSPGGDPTKGRADVTVRNDGPHVLDPRLVSIVLDGHVVDGNVTKRSIDGVDHETHVWGPGESLTLRVDPLAAEPARILVVCGNGASDLWTASGG